MRKQNLIRDKLTEHETNFRKCNLNLISCYAGLYPATLTKLSVVIFNKILSNKKYIEKSSAFYDEQEDKRIYTNIPISTSDLLMDCHPVKYRDNSNDINTDSGNLVKRLKELDDNNIFYVWRLGRPNNYMFVMERDIGLWRYYNGNAHVTPKTVKKIILSTKGMCNSMFKILKERGDNVSPDCVRNSFCKFVNRIVDKMDPSLSKDFGNFSTYSSCKEYLIDTKNKICQMDPYSGLSENKSFERNLPNTVFCQINKKCSPKVNSEKMIELQKQIGSSENLKDFTTEKNKKKRKPSAKTKVEKFSRINPLKNATSLLKFYRNFLKANNSKIVFCNFESEISHAGEILDEVNKGNCDERFLRSWMSYFIETKLKGENSRNQYKTSIGELKKTYCDYKVRYIG